MNKTLTVMQRVPVLNETGNTVFRQCKPKLKTTRAISANVRDAKTANDLLSRFKVNQWALNIVRGKY